VGSLGRVRQEHRTVGDGLKGNKNGRGEGSWGLLQSEVRESLPHWEPTHSQEDGLAQRPHGVWGSGR
jgi:hypothetical protein